MIGGMSYSAIHVPTGARTAGTFSKALLVDSHPDTRFLYRVALSPLAAMISEAEDGAEALGKAVCQQPTLVVTETVLPRIDGVALCHALRRHPGTAGTRIVFVTSAAGASARARVMAAGADAVLVKPCSIGDLVATVRRLCCGSDLEA